MRIAAPLAVAALLLLAHPLAAQPAASAEDLYRAGVEAYDRRDFAAAWEAWMGARRAGVRDARLEYALGNAAFRLNRLGAAILHYQRASRLDPADEDVRRNLELARARIADRIPEEESAPLLRALHAAQHRVGPDRQLLGVLVLVWATGAVVAWRGARPGGFTPGVGWVLAILLSMGLALAASWRVTLARIEGGRLAVVLADAADVRSGPGEGNAALLDVHEGLTVRVRGEREGWVQVGLPNGVQGWVRRDALGFV
jgi:tetratricopeptide (TPR) repeat protein